MINATELRIGNWVREDVLGIVWVAGIEQSAVLTPEILEKCGFKEIGYSGDFWHDEYGFGDCFGRHEKMCRRRKKP